MSAGTVTMLFSDSRGAPGAGSRRRVVAGLGRRELAAGRALSQPEALALLLSLSPAHDTPA